MELITVNDLSMQFGQHRALDSVDFTVHHGVTGLVGANGAGKTTFMSIALGLRAPTNGSIRVLDLEPVSDGAQLRSLVSYGPERNILPDEMPAVDFVKHLAEVRGSRGKKQRHARKRRSMARWPRRRAIPSDRNHVHRAETTSKLAQAIAADPQLVFLDEPTDGLDPLARDEVLTLIRQVSEEYGIHVMISSHLLEEVEQICDNIVILNAGKLVAAGQLDKLTGESTGLEIELIAIDDYPNSIEDVQVALQNAGIKVLHEPESTILRIPDGSPELLPDLIRDAVADSGARLKRLEHRRRSLEDIILDVPS